MNFSIAIIGTGALGAYYGARLAHAGYDVHFVLHSDYEFVKKHGLRVESPLGDFSIANPNVYAGIENLPPCDVLCLTAKSTANNALIPFLPSKLKENGAIVVLQNGLGIEELIQDSLAPQSNAVVLGGLCFLCSNKVGPGHIKHLDYGDIRLGALANSTQSNEWIQKISQALNTAGIGTTITPELQKARWQKLVWNIPFNGLSVLLNANTREIIQNPQGRALIEALMQEVVEAAFACGAQIPSHFIDKMISDTERMTPYLPSMRLDYDRKQNMEIEAIYSIPIEIAKKHGYNMVLATMVRNQLFFKQSKDY